MMVTHLECLLALNLTQNSLRITPTTATINPKQMLESELSDFNRSSRQFGILTGGKITIRFWSLLLGRVR